MSSSTPENLESKYQRAKNLAQQSQDRILFYMGLTAVGIVGMLADMAYVNEKYHPLNTLEEIQRGQIDPSTEAALLPAVGIFGFELFAVACTFAAGYKTYQVVKYRKEANKVLKEMESRSKRPPTLGF